MSEDQILMADIRPELLVDDEDEKEPLPAFASRQEDGPRASKSPLARFFYELRDYPRLRAVDFLLVHNAYIRHRLAYERLVDQGEAGSPVALAHKARFEACRQRASYGARLIVMSVVGRWVSNTPKIECLQEGLIGVIEALDRYDPTNPEAASFPTFVRYWIKHHIGRFQQNHGRIIREPVHFREKLNRLERFRLSFMQKHGRMPDELECADWLSEATEPKPETGKGKRKRKSRKEYVEQLRGIQQRASSLLSLSYQVDRSGESETTLEQVLLVPGQSTPEDEFGLSEVFDLVDSAYRRFLIALRGLPPMQQTILKHRLELDDAEHLTLLEIGSKFNLSRERIRQLQAAAGEQLAKQLGLEPEDVHFLCLARARLAHLLGISGGRAYDPERSEEGWNPERLERLLDRLKNSVRRSFRVRHDVEYEPFELKHSIEEVQDRELAQREADAAKRQSLDAKEAAMARQREIDTRNRFLERYADWQPAKAPDDPPLPWTVSPGEYVIVALRARPVPPPPLVEFEAFVEFLLQRPAA